MLVLTRRVGERIRVGDDTWITITGIGTNQVKIGFEVPDDVQVLREELIDRPQRAQPGRVHVGHAPAGIRIGKDGT